MIKVRATQIGFYNNATYNPGDIFEISEEKLFSEKWMEKVPDAKSDKISVNMVPIASTPGPVILTGKEPIKEPRRDLPPVEPAKKPDLEHKI